MRDEEEALYQVPEPPQELSTTEAPKVKGGDGLADIIAWYDRANDSIHKVREPVIIEGDVRLMNWSLITHVQWMRYGRLFNVIIMDPPWRVGLRLKYPTLSDAEIFSIPSRP